MQSCEHHQRQNRPHQRHRHVPLCAEAAEAGRKQAEAGGSGGSRQANRPDRPRTGLDRPRTGGTGIGQAFLLENQGEGQKAKAKMAVGAMGAGLILMAA